MRRKRCVVWSGSIALTLGVLVAAAAGFTYSWWLDAPPEGQTTASPAPSAVGSPLANAEPPSVPEMGAPRPLVAATPPPSPGTKRTPESRERPTPEMGEPTSEAVPEPDDVENDGRLRGEAPGEEENLAHEPDATGLLADLNDAPEATPESPEPDSGPVDSSGAVPGQAVEHDVPAPPTYRATGADGQ